MVEWYNFGLSFKNFCSQYQTEPLCTLKFCVVENHNSNHPWLMITGEQKSQVPRYTTSKPNQ